MALKENDRSISADPTLLRKSFQSENQVPFTASHQSQLLKNNKTGENELTNAPIATKIINMNEIKKSTHYGKKIFSDSHYEGELLNGRRHGKGIMIYNTGRFYEGGWVDDYREGKGLERYSNGNTYEGDYKRGKPDGKGIYTWNNGEIYDGEWKDGLKHGDGIWKGINGDSYIGEWRFSKADGYGVHIWKTGDRYEGEWKACLKHGNGTDIFANGDSYIGQYKFGKPCGYGRYIWKDGSFYVGEFYDGVKSGFGKWRKSNSHKANMYEGQYFRDKKQGFGIFKWASGNVYKGQYRNDEREGIGEMKWTDGSLYIGMWSRGIQHGYGKMWFPGGEIKEGLFEKNVYKGVWEGEVPLPEGFDIMDLAPKDMTFSEEILCFSPMKSQPRTSYAQVRPPTQQHRFMTASEKPRLYDRNLETPLYAAPIRRQVGYRCMSKDARTEKIRKGRILVNTNTQQTTANQTMYTADGSGYEDSAPVRFRRTNPNWKKNIQKTAYGGFDWYGSPQKNYVKKETKKVWRPAGKVHYAEPYKKPRPYF